MAKTLSAAVAVLLLAPSAASADWQFTHWGMSPVDVKKASQNQAYSVGADDAAFAKHEMVSATGAPMLSMPYASGALRFTAIFAFEGDRLSAVVLKADQAEDATLTDSLTTKYGTPLNRRVDDDAGLIEWVTDRDHVRYMRFLSTVSVTYSPRNSGSANGL